jgi:hypothetical protein
MVELFSNRVQSLIKLLRQLLRLALDHALARSRSYASEHYHPAEVDSVSPGAMLPEDEVRVK